jgi:predicted transcriptional regulator
MSDLPDHGEPSFVSYVSKATFIHLWDKFKQKEKDLAEAQSINQSLAASVLRLGNECRDQADQVKALKEELEAVMEDLHRANDIMAKLFPNGGK